MTLQRDLIWMQKAWQGQKRRVENAPQVQCSYSVPTKIVRFEIMSGPGTQRPRAVSREGISLHSEKVGPLYRPVASMLHLLKFQMSPCSQDTDKGDKLR